jgi:hypothetical protein
MLFDYIVLTCAIDWFLLSVEDSGLIEDVNGIDGCPWTLDQVREWIFYGLSVFFISYVTYEWYIMMLILDR